MTYLAAILAVACGCLGATTVMNIPYHRQVTQYMCGDAVMEMAFHRVGPDVDQKMIANVARTSFEMGTFSADFVRAAHFSELSTAQGHQFPDHMPKKGWGPEARTGLAAFARRGTNVGDCWLSDLKATISLGFPVAVLQWYDTNPADETHYRYAMGFDDSSVVLYDPWDRSNGPNEGRQPRLLNLTNAQFCGLWNYSESNGKETELPYFGAAIFPWEVVVEHTQGKGNDVEIYATVTYPCPPAFCSGTESIAENATATLALPPQLILKEGRLMKHLGKVTPGVPARVHWTATSNQNYDGKGDKIDKVEVSARGVITGSVGYAFCCGNSTYYPPYTYRDYIGGTGNAMY